jgi:imidazole glycerol-phosphate synthase subunit HisH
MKVTIVPTGTANLASVRAAFRRLGAEPTLARSSDDIVDANRLVLPGVGAFGAAMRSIDEREWRGALVERIETGHPTLAICLGMQLLTEASDESPGVRGLGLVRGSVAAFPASSSVPQLGWNRVEPDPGTRFVRPGWAYFANSYRRTEPVPGWTVATTTHGDRFVSAIERGDVLACQFHPELSGGWGSRLLDRWLAAGGRGS